MGRRSDPITFRALIAKINAGKKSDQPVVNIACGEGLYVRLIGAQKTIGWYFRNDGKFTFLGKYSEFTLAAIRQKLKQKIADQELQNTIKTLTFGFYKEKWLETKKNRIRITNIKKTAEYLSPLDKIPIKDIKNPLIKNALLQQKITPYKIRECISAVCSIMDLAVEDDIIEYHKCSLLKKSQELPKHIKGSGYKWQPVENFGTLFDRFAHTESIYIFFYLLQALTGLRSGTCRTLKKSYFDFAENLIVIPGQDMKIKVRQNQLRKPFRIPITKSIESLYKCIQLSCPTDSDYIFVRNNGTPLLERDIALPMQTVASDLAHPHGFRKSMRTWMAENGISEEVAELCIDHAVYSKNSSGSKHKEQSFTTDDEYQKSDLLMLRRKALEAYDNAVVANLPTNLKRLIQFQS